jgi:hypothetical protein
MPSDNPRSINARKKSAEDASFNAQARAELLARAAESTPGRDGLADREEINDQLTGGVAGEL